MCRDEDTTARDLALVEALAKFDLSFVHVIEGATGGPRDVLPFDWKALKAAYRAKGGKGFELHKSIEKPQRYRLMAQWETLENHTVDFRGLAHQGMTLVGLTKAFDNGVVTFQPDLADNLARGDENYLELLDAADAYIARNGLDLPEEPEARSLFPDPECVTKPLLELDLAKAGVTSIIWATGYAVDFSWLQVNAFDAKGKPQHQRGVSSEPGVYFLGLPWLSRRGSSFIWGVWHDAKHVAGHIATQRTYLAYRDSAARQHAD